MDLKEAKLIVETLRDNGVEGVRLSEDYSGRFMYGRTTAAVLIDHISQLALMGWAAAQCEAQSITIMNIEAWRMDNMGRGYVIY